MLKQRFITAMILIPVVVSAVLFLHRAECYGVSLVLVAWCGWEWSTVIPLKQDWARWLFVAILIGLYVCLFWVPIVLVLTVSAVFWCLALLYIFSYPNYHPRWTETRFARMVMGVMSILPCWYSLNVLCHAADGRFMLLYLLVLIWLADIVAYFVGKYCGKRKLAPQVSPNKTIEGALGGLVFCLFYALVVAWFFALPTQQMTSFVVLSMITAMISIVGDLFMSVKKRMTGVKDMGALLPGHGGLLDRLDSLLSAAPVFTFLIMLMSFL